MIVINSFSWRRLAFLAAVAGGLAYGNDGVARNRGNGSSGNVPEDRRERLPLLLDLSSSVPEINPAAFESLRVRIVAPDGRVFVGRRDRLDRDCGEGCAWVGRLEGAQVSKVVFGLSHGRIAGVVDRSANSPQDRWEVRPQGENGYQVATGAGVGFTCGEPATVASGPAPNFAPAGPLSPGTAVNQVQATTLTKPTIVDLLVVYSPASRTRFGQSGLAAMIVQAVADANTALANSHATTILRLVGMQEVAHVESPSVDIGTVVGRMIVGTDGFLDTVPVLRNQFGADVVSLVSEDTGASGVAYIPFFQGAFRPDWNYNVVNSGALLSGAFTHEVGHNLGCNHDRNNLGSTGQAPYPYSFGIQQCGFDGLGFRDIMAYECNPALGVSQRLNYFSNPWLSYLGRPLGVDHATDPSGACDNARTIREASPTIASFRDSAQLLPLAPHALGVTVFAFNQLDLVWTQGSGDYALVEIQRASASDEDWAPVTFLPGSAASFSDRQLLAGSAYRYRIRGHNSAGMSEFSPAVSSQTPAEGNPPASLTGLSATVVSKARINLVWTDGATTEDGYRIERSINGGPFELQGITAHSMTGYDDGASIQMGSTYAYRVTPFNGAGDGQAATATVIVPTLPASPTGLTVTPLTANSAVLSWTDASDNETGFDLQRSVDGVIFQTVATRSANVTSFTNAGLQNGVNYRYRVWSRNASGYSLSPSATSSVVWGSAPATPGNLSATTPSPFQVDLSWLDNASNETAYLIERAGADGSFSQIGLVGPNLTVFSDTSVVGSTTYSYRVRAGANDQFSAYSPVAMVTTPLPPPAAPSGLAVTGFSSTQVSLVWVDNANNETSYLVERAVGSGTFSQVGAVGAGVTTYQDTSVTAGTTYNFKVRAANSAGNSLYSAVVSVTTPISAPSAPSRLSASVVSSIRVELTWRDNASNESAYLVQRAGLQGTYTTVATLGANVTSYQDTSVSPSSSYNYRVRARNAGGDSAASQSVFVSTPSVAPLAPSGLTAAARRRSSVRLAWVDNSNNETGFYIERQSGGSWTQIGNVSANVTSVSVNWLSASTPYVFRIRARNSGGYSNYSNTATATTLAR